MLALLNWRVWAALIVAAGLAFSHFTAYRKGKQNVRLEWAASVAAADKEARRLERARQSRVDDVVRLASSRADRLRADAGGAADAVQRLRLALSASEQRSAQSLAAATERADSLGKLLVASAEAHRELAARCDRHVNDLRMLLEAWPQ